MGLVEGPGGLGQGGAAATLGGDSRDAEGKYEEYGYNAQLSDRISLDRSIPDYRPKKYVHLMSHLLPCTVSFQLQHYTCFSLQQGCVVLERLGTWRFSSLIPAAVDGLHISEGTQCTTGLYARKLVLSSSILCFSLFRVFI